jgi:hypothetical protein
MATANEYEIAAAGLALLLSTYSVLTYANIIADFRIKVILAAIKDTNYNFEYDYWRYAIFAFLFLVSLIVFLKLMFCTFVVIG